ncbi:class I SAM-dependent methyltransferase [Mycobacterium sp. MFM001]|uniref:class I SAM-dependent methyltransferase n=1 Tax=Mycobacterium sp. MFM001 TaxID=2049453 RepID=UPI001EDFA113|nr:class I SAM-dependent methyltransferase [Mycobacterium sp. MFM001]
MTRYIAVLLRVGSGRPSVLWHYFADNLRYLLTKLGILSGAAKHVSEVRAAFEAYAATGQFKELFFDMADMNILQWSTTFSKIFARTDPIRILEIGSWEGRSTLFLLTYFTKGQLTAVDTWAGSTEGYKYDATQDLHDLEARFDSNLAPCAERLTKRKGSSLHVLPQLIDEKQEFDLIYVDGSHHADDVLTDAINSWRLLKEGGVIIFDDFLGNFYPRVRANPWWPINLFLKYHAGEYRILNAYYQIVLQKKVTFVDQATDLAAVQFGDPLVCKTR